MPRRDTVDPYALAVGQRIDMLRKRKRWTLAELGERVECSKGHLSNIIHGLAMPTVDTIRRIACAFDAHPGALLPEAGARGDLVVRVAMLAPARCSTMALRKKRIPSARKGSMMEVKDT